MSYIQFKWDKNKEQVNIKKHHITFTESKTAFYDPNARIIPDPDHSENEERFILIGLSLKLKLLIVCHCYLEKDNMIRIISARKATKNESKKYGGK